MASVTVKAYAELIHTPLFGQLRILREQKYPKQTDGQFKIPYYQPALRCIHRYYRTGNNPLSLPQSINHLTGCGTQQARIDNNWRTLKAFRTGSQVERKFTVIRHDTQHAGFGDVEMRATPDLMVHEDGTSSPRFIIYNCCAQAPGDEIVRTTVELFHFALEQNGVSLPMNAIEYICLDGDKVHRFNSRRKKTIDRAQETAQAIAALWNSI